MSNGPGRRPGNPDTRAEILVAAQALFAEQGYDRTSMRGIARAAGVDPRTVHHYFESKEAVLLASLGSRIDPREVIAEAAQGPDAGRAERVARAFLTAWEEPDVRGPFLAVIQGAASSEASARLLREGLISVVLTGLSPYLKGDDQQLRLELIASQMIGLAYLRYVVRLEPLASAPIDELAPRLARALDTYVG